MLGCSVRTPPFSAPHDAMLTMLVCATHWLSMHLYMLANMFMHESCLLVSHLYFNTMKSWTSDPNLHLSPRRHHLLFACFLVCLPSSSLAQLVCLFACLSAFQFVCLSCCLSCLLPHAMLASLVCQFALYPLRIIYASLSFHCLSASFLLLPLHVHTWSEDAWSQGIVSQAQAKRARMQAYGYEPSDYVQQNQGSSLSHLFMYSFKPPSFLPVFSLRWVVLVLSCHVPFILISRVWQPLFTFLHL